jgi:hypothetical protein
MLAAPCALSIGPFVLWNPGAFWRDVVLFTSGGIADAYPISGFGLGGLLVTLRILHPGDYFPFGILQLLALAPIFWLAWRLRALGPTLGRFIGAYTAAFFAFAFLARFFAHNYVAVLVALGCCIVPLAGLPFRVDASTRGKLGNETAEPLSAA